MSVFSAAELAYLRAGQLLGRLATVGPDGLPHVAPVGWSLDAAGTVIEISGRNFGRSKKFRDVLRTGVAALVIDDVLPPWRPRGVEVRGRAEAVEGSLPRILLRPGRIVSWGLESGASIEDTYRARDV
ncbi:PPOX class F420-dependent oxidoreductase [Nonomuraea zeae]|uniref:PPOX class F420-dependent oxidoreductase n=1 Tax=Nonomuraea zeae TaxID=1642303 RepID=A0A5S4GA26_9ACTN|nr:PPOX class F420-dependent oxidoreductase [Nonomuraea zeae]TMR29866.1 PPOX class F420-dependent oxidoreductase [Nonomuraea zeae]